MASVHKKGVTKDARSLFKQASQARAQKGKVSDPRVGGLAKKTKAELLEILKAKQEEKKRQLEEEQARQTASAEAEDMEEEEQEEEEEPLVEAPAPSKGNALPAEAAPASPPAQLAIKQVAQESLLGVGYSDDEEEDEEGGDEQEAPAPASGKADAEKGSAVSGRAGGSALPQNFFDDPEANDKARGIDPAEREKEKLKKEWEEFQLFAAEVKETEEVEAAEAEEDEQERDDRAELEQMAYVGRLAGLMKKSDNIGKKRRNPPDSSAGAAAVQMEGVVDDEDAEIEALQAVTAESAPEDSAVSEVSVLMRGRKKRKKQATEDILDEEYVPLDPLDWRSKGF